MALSRGFVSSGSRATRKWKADDFILEEVIGGGSFSSVVRATLKGTDKAVAIKSISKSHLLKHKMDHTVYIERDIMNYYPHPFVVTCYGYFQDNDYLYFVLEYCLFDFSQIHKKIPLHIEYVRFYSAEIVEALAHLHSKGIIHRDLKPENVFLGEDGHIRIGDFGSAMFTESNAHIQEFRQVQNRTRHFVGTPLYIAPEIIRNEPATEKSDIWALGLIIYFLLVGSPLFVGQTQFLLFQRIVKAKYSLPPTMDEAAKDLISHLVVQDPTERFSIDQIKSHPFFSGIIWGTLHLQGAPYKHTPTPPQSSSSSSSSGSQPASSSSFTAPGSSSLPPTITPSLPPTSAHSAPLPPTLSPSSAPTASPPSSHFALPLQSSPSSIHSAPTSASAVIVAGRQGKLEPTSPAKPLRPRHRSMEPTSTASTLLRPDPTSASSVLPSTRPMYSTASSTSSVSSTPLSSASVDVVGEGAHSSHRPSSTGCPPTSSDSIRLPSFSTSSASPENSVGSSPHPQLQSQHSFSSAFSSASPSVSMFSSVGRQIITTSFYPKVATRRMSLAGKGTSDMQASSDAGTTVSSSQNPSSLPLTDSDVPVESAANLLSQSHSQMQAPTPPHPPPSSIPHAHSFSHPQGDSDPSLRALDSNTANTAVAQSASLFPFEKEEAKGISSERQTTDRREEVTAGQKAGYHGQKIETEKENLTEPVQPAEGSSGGKDGEQSDSHLHPFSSSSPHQTSSDSVGAPQSLPLSSPTSSASSSSSTHARQGGDSTRSPLFAPPSGHSPRSKAEKATSATQPLSRRSPAGGRQPSLLEQSPPEDDPPLPSLQPSPSLEILEQPTKRKTAKQAHPPTGPKHILEHSNSSSSRSDGKANGVKERLSQEEKAESRRRSKEDGRHTPKDRRSAEDHTGESSWREQKKEKNYIESRGSPSGSDETVIQGKEKASAAVTSVVKSTSASDEHHSPIATKISHSAHSSAESQLFEGSSRTPPATGSPDSPRDDLSPAPFCVSPTIDSPGRTFEDKDGFNDHTEEEERSLHREVDEKLFCEIKEEANKDAPVSIGGEPTLDPFAYEQSLEHSKTELTKATLLPQSHSPAKEQDDHLTCGTLAQVQDTESERASQQEESGETLGLSDREERDETDQSTIKEGGDSPSSTHTIDPSTSFEVQHPECGHSEHSIPQHESLETGERVEEESQHPRQDEEDDDLQSETPTERLKEESTSLDQATQLTEPREGKEVEEETLKEEAELRTTDFERESQHSLTEDNHDEEDELETQATDVEQAYQEQRLSQDQTEENDSEETQCEDVEQDTSRKSAFIKEELTEGDAPGPTHEVEDDDEETKEDEEREWQLDGEGEEKHMEEEIDHFEQNGELKDDEQSLDSIVDPKEEDEVATQKTSLDDHPLSTNQVDSETSQSNDASSPQLAQASISSSAVLSKESDSTEDPQSQKTHTDSTSKPTTTDNEEEAPDAEVDADTEESTETLDASEDDVIVKLRKDMLSAAARALSSQNKDDVNSSLPGTDVSGQISSSGGGVETVGSSGTSASGPQLSSEVSSLFPSTSQTRGEEGPREGLGRLGETPVRDGRFGGTEDEEAESSTESSDLSVDSIWGWRRKKVLHFDEGSSDQSGAPTEHSRSNFPTGSLQASGAAESSRKNTRRKRRRTRTQKIVQMMMFTSTKELTDRINEILFPELSLPGSLG